MSKLEVLNNIKHQDFLVNPVYSEELGDSVSSTIAYVTEFSDLQKEYPILFKKNPENGTYQAVVFFGFSKNENLFLVEPNSKKQRNLGWSAEYVPAVIAKGPFSIILQRNLESGIENVMPMIGIDMESPKVSKSTGIRLFEVHGGNSGYIQNISILLNKIRDGIVLNKAMFDMFIKYELLEDVNIEIDLVNDERFSISGFETINLERLQSLNSDALYELNRAGFLQAAYFAAASVSNIKKLIEIKNRKIMA